MKLYPVNAQPAPALERQSIGSDVSAAGERFSDVIASGISNVNKSLTDGDAAIQKLHSGEAQNLHEVMLAVEQADISLRMFVQIRNRALQAYEEILRLQV